MLHLKCYEYLLVTNAFPSKWLRFCGGNWQQSGSQVLGRDLLGQMKENHFLLNAGAQSKTICLSLAMHRAGAVRAPPLLREYICSGRGEAAVAIPCSPRPSEEGFSSGHNEERRSGLFIWASVWRRGLINRTMLFGTSSLLF